MEEINQFLAGFRRFQRHYFCAEKNYFEDLRKGQKPDALVISCCDSRVDPALLTDCAPGDLFVARNVANLVPPYQPDSGYHGVSAALEFSVKSLKVKHIIVIGHSNCGGIKALMSEEKPADENSATEFIGQWVSIVEAAKKQVLEELPHKSKELQCRACEQAAVLVSLENLLSFPWVRERVEQNELALHGWYFDLERGELLGYDAETSRYETLVSSCSTAR